jgi:hypothetical protein
MNRSDAPPPAAGRAPVLLAEHDGVVFLAVADGMTGSTRWDVERPGGPRVVLVPAGPEEIAAADPQATSAAGAWRRVTPRPDLLAPALARMSAGEHEELALQAGADGLKATLASADGQRRPYPIAARDAMGLLAAVFQNAPRGVLAAGGPAGVQRLLLLVAPGKKPHEYRLRIGGIVAQTPSTLDEAGLSPAVREIVQEALDRPAGLVLISGGSASGLSTTLELLGRAVVDRGRRGGRIGPRPAVPQQGVSWIAESLSDWPFSPVLATRAAEFMIVERLADPRDLSLAARIASAGLLVMAGLPAGDPHAYLRRIQRELSEIAVPVEPILVIAQDLVRTPCPACLAWQDVPPARLERLGFQRRELEAIGRKGGLPVPRGRGCRACAGTGFAGLAGVFSCATTGRTSVAVPTLKEEGWRKVLAGAAWYEDVVVLPGGPEPQRSTREVVALSGSTGDELGHAQPETRDLGTAGDGHAGVDMGAAPIPPGSAELDAEELARLLRVAPAGSPPRRDRVLALAATLAGRAAHGRLASLLAATGPGFHPTRHAVNTALIAVRLVTALGQDEDGPATALLALLHDAGLVAAGVDPGIERPDTSSEESLDPSGSRLRPSAVLGNLGFEDAEIAARIGEVHAILAGDGAAAARPRTDLRSQAVALAALVHREFRLGRARGLDLHDVTSLVMAAHGQRFSPLLFRSLLRAIPIFPIGCLVELSSGDVGRVVSLTEENHFRPRVEITAGRGRGTPGELRVVDLARAPFLHIRHRVAPSRPAAGGQA